MENLKVLFPVHIRKKIKNNLWLNDLEEIRIRAGQPIELAYSGKTRYLTDMDGEMCACAPMAGLTDAACRHLMGDHGAAWTVSEMASAKALNFHV